MRTYRFSAFTKILHYFNDFFKALSIGGKDVDVLPLANLISTRSKIMATFHLTIKSGKKGSALDHSAYITRAGKHGKDDKAADLVATGSGNLPTWATEPKEFWQQADAHERENGAVYREYEMALPNELNAKQQEALVGDFIRDVVGDKTYEFAIHRPEAAIGKVPQAHVHLMISDRVPDGIERSPEQHFHRFNRAHPENGGCRKDSCGRDRQVLRNEVVSCRETWAKLQNDHLERHGHTTRVDHRSYQERGLAVAPEQHFGPARIRQMGDEERKAIQDRRQDKISEA